MAPGEWFNGRRRGGFSYALVPGGDAEGSRSSKICKIVVTILSVLAVTAATVVFCRVYLGPVLQWLMDLGGWEGPTLYGGLIMLSAIPPMWGYMVLNVGAGYIYGVLRGTVLTSVAALAGSLLAMLLCRFLLKSCTEKILKRFSNFAQLARLMEGEQGLKIVMMTRLTPVPFGIQNALFAATGISFQRFSIATFLALLPTQLLNSYLGTTLRSLDEVVKGNSNAGMMIAQVVMMVWVTWYVNRRMKREMVLACERDAIEQATSNGERSGSSDLREALVNPSERESVVSIPSADGDLLDSWIPFDLAALDAIEDGVFSPELHVVSDRPSEGPPSRGAPEPGGEHRPASFTARVSDADPRASADIAVRGHSRGQAHRRSRSADLGLIPGPSAGEWTATGDG